MADVPLWISKSHPRKKRTSHGTDGPELLCTRAVPGHGEGVRSYDPPKPWTTHDLGINVTMGFAHNKVEVEFSSSTPGLARGTVSC